MSQPIIRISKQAPDVCDLNRSLPTLVAKNSLKLHRSQLREVAGAEREQSALQPKLVEA